MLEQIHFKKIWFALKGGLSEFCYFMIVYGLH